MSPDGRRPDLATTTPLRTSPPAPAPVPARVPRRTRVALIVAPGIAILGLIARPFLGSTHAHAQLAPASALPTPPPTASAGGESNEQLSAIAQHAAVRALACAPPSLEAPVRSAGGSCGALVISAIAVLPPIGATDAKDLPTSSLQCGQCWTVEITGQLLPASTDRPESSATTSVGEPLGMPVALRITLVHVSAGWLTQVGQP